MPHADYYPSWLTNALVSGSFPWSQAARTELAIFLASYSLHDSEWIAFTLDPVYSGGGLAVIRWDTIWTEGRVPFPGSIVAEWPVLLVRFHRVHQVRQPGYETEAPVPTRGIADAESQPLPNSTSVRTVVSDHYGAQLVIEHAPEVDVLCLDRHGAVLAIPDFSAA
jgi:hypothetical protein